MPFNNLPNLTDEKQKFPMPQLPFKFTGKVIQGDQRGRLLGFPTANLSTEDKNITLLDEGVYGCKVEINKKTYLAAANIGQPKTFNIESKTIEIHILDFSEDIYNQAMKVELIGYIRQVIKFANIGELVEQIKKDIQTVRSTLEI